MVLHGTGSYSSWFQKAAERNGSLRLLIITDNSGSH